MVVNDLKNAVLIGLTVALLASAAWWLDPQRSSAQLSGEGSGTARLEETEGAGASGVTRGADTDLAKTQPATRPAAKPPSLHHLLGIDTARARLGKAIPTGKGITVGHVEVGAGQYLPNTRSPRFKGVTFVERSGPSKVSGHAFATAREIYGLTGLAPGVSVVHCFESRDWMSFGYLNAGTDDPPVGGPMRVLTHSWVSDAPNAVDVLRRIDWQIDMRDTVVCVGVNNGKQTPVPYLLGTAFNVIAVGSAKSNQGGSSGGYTRVETRGRSKPDIVGPRGLTSFTTPAVAACATRLLQAADEMTKHSHRAGKAEVIKAVLLAGAVKPAGWQQQAGHPLDEHLGAGVVHFDHSLQIMQAGPPAVPGSADAGSNPGSDPVRLPKRMGWDLRTIEADQKAVYTFATQAPMGEASIILTWHRRVTGVSPSGGDGWAGLPRTADLNLRLIHTDDNGDEHDLAVSNSRVDNVEHIYLKNLEAGRYRLEVTRRDGVYDEPWDYALAWRVELLSVPME